MPTAETDVTTTLDAYARRKAAFFELLDLDAAARERRLSEIAFGDAALADALRQQLDAASVPNPLLDRAAGIAQPPTLPHYRVVSELGRGGMGVVWLAERRMGDALQVVAIKQIAHASWTGDDLKRFQRERRILASLDHPNIAALVDGGTDAHGAPYLATQYVEGERIDRWCSANDVDARGRVRLVRAVARAAAYAHRKLVVHRDLKPANILVTRDGTPKLLDFGIARALAEEAVTTDGPSQMTLRYAAPEQVAGDSEVGVGVDVYALGVLLFELLACDSPYGDSTGPAALMRAVLEHEPAPPSRSPRALVGVDRDLDAIVACALRKSPSDRYRSADALADDLDRWLSDEPVLARDDERGYRFRKLAARHWPAVAGVLAIVAAGIGFVVYDLRATQAQLAAVERERDKAQALASYFAKLFESAKPAETDRGDISARELLERSVARLETDTSQTPQTRATLLLAAGDALGYLGHALPARDARLTAIELVERARVDDPELSASLHSELASDLYKTGDLAGAKRSVETALGYFARGEARDADRRLTVRQQAAMYAEESGDIATARAVYEQIVRETAPNAADKRQLESYLAAQSNLATGDSTQNPVAAAARLRDALAMAERHRFDDPTVLLPMRAYLGTALVNQSKFDEALAVLRPTVEAARAYYGPRDPWLDLLVGIGGKAEYCGGDLARGRAWLTEASTFRRATMGPDAPATQSAEGELALASALSGDWADAVQRASVVEAWLAKRDESSKPLGAWMRAVRAYAEAKRDPNPASVAALRGALGNDDDWTGWKRGLVAKWRASID